MKKKVGELYNKPIVIGNENCIKDYEISLKDLQSSDMKFRYFKFNEDVSNEDKIAYATHALYTKAIDSDTKIIMLTATLVLNALSNSGDNGLIVDSIAILEGSFSTKAETFEALVDEVIPDLLTVSTEISKEEFFNFK